MYFIYRNLFIATSGPNFGAVVHPFTKNKHFNFFVLTSVPIPYSEVDRVIEMKNRNFSPKISTHELKKNIIDRHDIGFIEKVVLTEFFWRE